MQQRLTKDLIYGAALDAAKRSASKRGLTIMDEECAEAYHAEFDRLWEAIGGADGWMRLPKN